MRTRSSLAAAWATRPRREPSMSLHFPSIYQSARHLGIPLSEIDDVTQEVFERAFKRLDGFGGGNFPGMAPPHLRECRHGPPPPAPGARDLPASLGRRPRGRDVDPSPEGAAAQAQAEQHVSAILSRMRPKLREVFALFELERLSGDEIAERLECPAATVRTRLFHARREFLRIGRQNGWIEIEGAQR